MPLVYWVVHLSNMVMHKLTLHTNTRMDVLRTWYIILYMFSVENSVQRGSFKHFSLPISPQLMALFLATPGAIPGVLDESGGLSLLG